MSYFKFINENFPLDEEDITTTTKEFNSEYLYDVIENFEMFLRGCGFHFNGHLDFVQEDEEFEDMSAAERNDKNVRYPTFEVHSPEYDDSITITGASEK